MKLIELPKHLYKYISWEKEYHRRMLTENEIFFTSAENFNDPFDSSVPLRYDLGTKEQIIELYKSHVAHLHPNLTNSEIERVAINEMRIYNIQDPEIIEKNINYQRKWAIEKYGIFSMTTEHNNILMWSHYANAHKGICLRFNSELILDFIKTDCVKKELLIVWDKLSYKSEYPLLNPFELNDNEIVIKSLFIKSNKWEYENEFRLILFDHPNKAIIFPEGIIDQVILGCNISMHDKNIIKKITFEKDIELFQAQIKRNEFGLELVREIK